MSIWKLFSGIEGKESSSVNILTIMAVLCVFKLYLMSVLFSAFVYNNIGLTDFRIEKNRISM